MSFSMQLSDAVKARGNPVCVGLDPRWDSLPPSLTVESPTPVQQAEAYRQFCQQVIDVVADLVPVVKPQMAFFEQLGPAGLQALHEVIGYAQQRDLLVVLDGKRNDIGSTASAYASAYLGRTSPWGADALTVSPYLGDDSLTPFVEACRQRDAGIFVLVKTSNPGGRTLQDVASEQGPLYQHVARLVEQLARETAGQQAYGAVGGVVGATYPEQLAELRDLMPHAWLLVPGVGSQGGTAHDVRHAFDKQGLGAIINSSRAIIFAHRRPEYEAKGNWQQAVESATRDLIDQLRSETPAGHLA